MDPRNIDYIKIERVQKPHVKQIVRISSQCAKEGFITAHTSRSILEKMNKKNFYYIIVARIAKNVVGYAISSYSWGKLHIEDIAVRKSFKRRGIGKKLMTHLIEHARQKQLPEAYLEVKAKNVPALYLYKSLNFKVKIYMPLTDDPFYGLYIPLEKK